MTPTFPYLHIPLSATGFAGNLHPALVHLPIGMLLLAAVLEIISTRPRLGHLRSALPTIYLSGAVAAILSCISGYLLSQDGGYEEQLLDRHKWLGIATALAASTCHALSAGTAKNEGKGRWMQVSAVAMAILLVMTGHLGGSITHGEGYLLKVTEKAATDAAMDTATTLQIADIANARAYDDIVGPLLRQKCATCHGASKQKGGLRLDGREQVLKGGKNGAVLVSSDPDASEIYKRLLLPLEDEHHMPPKGKPQLTKEEVRLIHWWIGTGARFDAKASELPQDEQVKKALDGLARSPGKPEPETNWITETAVEKAPEAVIQRLEKAGVAIRPVAPGSNYLQAHLMNATAGTDSLLEMLTEVRAQLVWLRLSDTKPGREGIRSLGKLTALRRLFLDRTGIDDASLAELKELRSLEYLTLTGNRISSAGLATLAAIPSLKRLYLFETDVKGPAMDSLRRLFPGTVLDSGGYRLPVLASDTTEVQDTRK